MLFLCENLVKFLILRPPFFNHSLIFVVTKYLNRMIFYCKSFKINCYLFNFLLLKNKKRKRLKFMSNSFN